MHKFKFSATAAAVAATAVSHRRTASRNLNRTRVYYTRPVRGGEPWKGGARIPTF